MDSVEQTSDSIDVTVRSVPSQPALDLSYQQNYTVTDTSRDAKTLSNQSSNTNSVTSQKGNDCLSLDVRILQLHALFHPQSSTPLCISATCLATYDSIFDVMASLLHQRRAW